jgi:CBS domain-containing protein/anti-sigma regulatory factor (Ser/Thr protein kinase)
MSGVIRQRVKINKTEELTYKLKVKEAMNKKVLALNPKHTVRDVRKMMKYYRVSAMPVIKAARLLGVINLEDLINCLSTGALHTKVTDIMTGKVVVLFSDEPLIHAIDQFNRHDYPRFPVLDRDSGKVVGIITKTNIIQCLLRTLESLYHAKESKEGRQSQTCRIFDDLPSDGTALTLKYHVKGGDFKRAGETSDQLKENFLKLGYSDEKIRRLIIAVLEAEMNLTIYTTGGNIIARIEPKKIIVNAIDDGPGIADIELAMQPGYSTAPDLIREMGFGAGMGLPNIKRCSDEMKIESHPGKGTNLEFSINI